MHSHTHALLSLAVLVIEVSNVALHNSSVVFLAESVGGLELDPHLRNKQKPKESSRGLPDRTCNTVFTWTGKSAQLPLSRATNLLLVFLSVFKKEKQIFCCVHHQSRVSDTFD